MTRITSPEDAELVVQKLPSDMGIHRTPRKGTLDAPGVLLDGLEFEKKVLVDEVFPDEFDLEETHRRIEENTEELLEYDKPLLSIGGDHSVSFPVLKALKKRHPDLQLVWLDAHLDMKEKHDGHVSHDAVLRELLDHGFDPSEVWVVGVTRVDGDEEEFLEDRDFNMYHSGEVERLLREFDSGEQPVYLSVDIDVLEGVEGTGYPDGELSLEQAESVIEAVEPSFADLVEVAPPLDDGETVEAARKLVRALVEEL